MINIYIAGPISGRPPSEYLAQFWQMERALEIQAKYTRQEIKVINPAVKNYDYAKTHTYDQIMARCFAWIDTSDMVVFLKGWENSRGANQEYGYAKAKGKMIHFLEV